MKSSLIVSLLLASGLMAADYSKVVEQPDASEIIKKDLLGPVTTYKMPADCITDDAKAIARGAYIFHNLNGDKAKGDLPEGLSKKNPDGKAKQYGNCVACHNIEGAKGAGNIGPDLHAYHANFIATGARDNAFVFQKIADARVDNADTKMTINLTTKLFNEREICDITSYIVSIKK